MHKLLGFSGGILLAGMLLLTNCKGDDLESFSMYVTKFDQSLLFKKVDTLLNVENSEMSIDVIEIDTSFKYQQIEGFGYTLNGGSAMHINNMSPAKRAQLLSNLFSNKGNGIGVSYLRLSIGASDLDEFVFSYNDLPKGETDLNLDNFSIAQDKNYLLPVIKEILAINPEMKFIATPWSAPAWMKTNKSSVGGILLPEYYEVYAQYFVKYIQAMKAEGINITAITPQNEPLHDGNNPSMHMTAEEQGSFIKNFLGPAFEAADIKTKIIIYDHNADKPEYPISILNDADANKYIDGSAFHLYGGSINALSTVHEAHPDKGLYFTEQWVGVNGNFSGDLKWHIQNVVVGSLNNWCKAIFEWNLAADSNVKPYTPGGCNQCLGALTIDGDNVTKNVAYYIIAHVSKFVLPGAVRIKSTIKNELPNVCFKNTDGSLVIVTYNDSDSNKTIEAKVGDKTYRLNLLANAVSTIVL